MFNGLSNAHLYTAYRIGAAFQLRGDATPLSKSGTAFAVRNEAGSICVITNRHILDAGYDKAPGKYLGAKLASVWIEGFVAPDDVNKKPVERITFDINLSMSPVKIAANYFEDVACFINPSISVRGGGPASISFYVDSWYLADDGWIESKLSVCDFVAFPGFPQWHDKLEKRPILRTGTIASDPRANYSNISEPRGRRMAYEAFSFDGSSGSPVYATEKGFRGGSGIEVVGHREGRLIGINAGHLPGDFGAHSGVSYFIKSSAILELIDGEG